MDRPDQERMTLVVQNTKSTRVAKIWIWLLAAVLLVGSGLGYRLLAERLKLIVKKPVTLPVSLSNFPMQLGNWEGEDVPIRQTVLKVAGNDDYLNRQYINKQTNEWSSVYLAYSARPRVMLGHRPDICYVAHGWVHDGTKKKEIISTAGRKIQCLIHSFHKPTPSNYHMIVLNYYISNGHITNDASTFEGLSWRTPNIAGDPALYITQVQISSILENSVRKVAREFTDFIMDYFPDSNGTVKAVEQQNRREFR